jgi:hypothetical protein
MTWQSLATIDLSNSGSDWILTPETSSVIFRLTHASNDENKLAFRGAIAQVIGEPFLAFESRQLFFRANTEAFLFPLPNGLNQRKLAIKKLSINAIDWNIQIEEFVDPGGFNLPIYVSDVVDLEEVLESKASAVHRHQISEIDNLQNNIQSLINQKISELQLKKTDKHFGGWKSLMYNEPTRSMLGTLSDKDANIMAAGRGIVTLFLGLVGDSISYESLINKKDFKGMDIAEWLFVGKRSNPQAAAYLNVFGKYGLKENGMLLWLSYNGGIGGYFIINADGSIYSSSTPIASR